MRLSWETNKLALSTDKLQTTDDAGPGTAPINGYALLFRQTPVMLIEAKLLRTRPRTFF